MLAVLTASQNRRRGIDTNRRSLIDIGGQVEAQKNLSSEVRLSTAEKIPQEPPTEKQLACIEAIMQRSPRMEPFVGTTKGSASRYITRAGRREMPRREANE